MENFIKSKFNEIEKTLPKVNDFVRSKKSMDVSYWKYFNILDLFDFEKGKDKSPSFNDGFSNGYLCAIAKNNNSGFSEYKKENPIKIFGGG